MWRLSSNTTCQPIPDSLICTRDISRLAIHVCRFAFAHTITNTSTGCEPTRSREDRKSTQKRSLIVGQIHGAYQHICTAANWIGGDWNNCSRSRGHSRHQQLLYFRLIYTQNLFRKTPKLISISCKIFVCTVCCAVLRVEHNGRRQPNTHSNFYDVRFTYERRMTFFFVLRRRFLCPWNTWQRFDCETCD